MRTNIIHSGASELTYDIRGIVAIAQKIAAQGVDVSWENIGDPIAKGHSVPSWIKDIITHALRDDRSFGYSPTRGIPETRAFIAQERTREGGAHLNPDDILFFNGLGDAISIVYTYLNEHARILGPSPAYPTHSSAEGAHAHSHHLTYRLDPHRGWMPDVEDIRNKVRYNPAIAGILIINPDNPTGAVYPRSVLEEIIAIAREYDLFVISDEIYANITYGEEAFVSLAQVVGNVPSIALRGLSKEVPWPGARCGWAEFYNMQSDRDFARYTKILHDAKMLEVCATTLPQVVLPRICGDVRYGAHLQEQCAFYKVRAQVAYEIFSGIPGVHVVRPQGAFYCAIVFDRDAVAKRKVLQSVNSAVGETVAMAAKNAQGDMQCVYEILGSTGICTVPLSSFNSDLLGLRITLLEKDEAQFEKMCTTLAQALRTMFTRGVSLHKSKNIQHPSKREGKEVVQYMQKEQ